MTAVATLGAAAIAAAIYWGLARPESPSAGRPWSLVVVSIDTLRADRLALYGGPVATPTLEALGSDGVVFDHAQTVAPLTLPAHASLFTGRWPQAHDVRDNVGFYLGEDVPTLAAHLGALGYRTGGFVSAFVLDGRFGIDRGFEHYFDEFDALSDDVSEGNVSQRPGSEVVARASAWIDDVGSGEAPYFAFVHLFEPHTPYDPPPAYRPDPGAESPETLYRGEIAYADALVGELIDRLRARGQLARTVVAVLSDHGESLGDHGEATHGLFVYESTIRVPLLLVYPGAPAGTRVQTLASLVDVAPTLLELMAHPPLDGAEGRSLLPAIGAPEEPLPRDGYAESFLPRLHYGWSPLRSLRRGEHKLILAPRPELYDLSSDPEESRNLFETEPEIATPLVRELTASFASDDEPTAEAMDSESLARLRSLGYLGGGSGTATSSRRTDEALADPKDRLDVYHAINDPRLSDLSPADGPAFAEALERLRSIVSEEPVIPRAAVLYGQLLLDASRPREAAAVFRGLVEREDSYEGWLGLGISELAAGDLDAADVAFQRALALEPSNTKSHDRLADVAQARGDVEGAVSWLLRAIEVNPDRVLRAKLANLYLSTGRTDDAREVLERIATEHGRDPVAFYNLGQSRLVAGDAVGALEMYRVAAELDPADPDIQQGIGNALLSSGDPRAALEAYDAVLALDDCYAAALANRGVALSQLGQTDEAVDALEASIRCAPDYLPGYRNLAAIELEGGDIDGAIDALSKARRLAPEDAELDRQLRELMAYRASLGR